MEIKNVEWAVVGGWYEDDGQTPTTIEFLGAYDNAHEAYGRAYLYLCDIEEGYRQDKPQLKITPAFALEAETGWGMVLEDNNRHGEAFAYVLFGNESEVES